MSAAGSERESTPDRSRHEPGRTGLGVRPVARRWPALALLALLVGLPAPLALAQNAATSRALIIGVAVYRDGDVPPLFGVPNDMDSARDIALALGIPATGIRELFNEDATKARIAAELARLVREVPEDGRVFVYFSGHGTRWHNRSSNACVEGLLTWDRQTIVNSEFADMVRPLGQRADKVLIMFDACHSGGVRVSTRSLSDAQPALRARFFARADRASNFCSVPSNVRTRSFGDRESGLGLPPEYFIQITSAAPDEVALDEPQRGGLGTQAIRKCLVKGGSRDLDGSGGITLAEVEACANEFVRDRLKGNSEFLPHHVGIRGYRNFIPVPVTLNSPGAAAPPPAAATPAPVAAPPPPAQPSAEQLRLEKERLREQQLAREREEREAAAALARQREELIRAERERLRREQAAEREREAERLRLSADGLADAAAVAAAAAAQAEREQAELELLVLQALAERERMEALNAATPPAPVPSPAPPPAETPRPPVVAQPAPLGPLASLNDLHAQRDPRHDVRVSTPSQRLRIGVDRLDVTVESAKAGYVYVLLLGSDETTFTLLFPNALDQANTIAANGRLRIPRPHWEVQAAGPAGRNQLLAIVSPTPRDLSALRAAPTTAASPFAYSAADLEGRQRLLDAFIGSGVGAGKRGFGAAWLTLEEVP